VGAEAGTPMPPDDDDDNDEKKNEKSSIDNIVKDKNGNYIEKVNKGATENIRTVSKQEFNNIRKELLKNSKKVREYSNCIGTWDELPNGDKFGIRHSSRHSEILDCNAKVLPRDFKIHQK
jgi:hypothetical protein